MKNSLNEYLNTLILSNVQLCDLIDINKILNHMQIIESDLNALNYIIANDYNTMISKIDFLYQKNKECFKSIYILAAIRNDKNRYYLVNGNYQNIDQIISSKNGIIDFLNQTNLTDFIINGKIKNFVDYTFGIEVGLDSNARKNRNGHRIEENIYDKLIVLFQDHPEIEISKQQKITYAQNKVFDIVITNTLNHKCLLIESSFYNAQGSKISETARGYDDLYRFIKNNLRDYQFIWLADGLGMKSISKHLENNFSKGYIWNHKEFFDSIKELIL